MNQLVDYILDGDADKLKDRSSDDEEVQELIDGVPKFEVVSIIRTTVFIGSLVSLIVNFHIVKCSIPIKNKSSNIFTYFMNRKELPLSTRL